MYIHAKDDVFRHFLEPKAPVTYCDRALSAVRRPLDNLHFRLLLQNNQMDFDEILDR